MIDIFELESEVSAKQKIIKQFSKWWSDDEIRNDVIPFIVDKNIQPSVVGALKNYAESSEFERKSFSEILYDLVGKNFLVNQDKYIRQRFLYLILNQKINEDPHFEKRFLYYLIESKKSYNGFCKRCKKRWGDSEVIYVQRLGDTNFECVDYNCIVQQQKEKIPHISDPRLSDFIQKFNLNRDYKLFCKKLIAEFDLPREVIFQPSKEIKLLPDVIQPLGTFSNLFDYQSSIGLKITDMLEHYSIDTSRALVVLPTGAGKTRLVVETLIEWINNGKKGKEKSKFILWIVDKNELCQQAFDTFADVFRHRGKRDSSLKLHPIYGNNIKNIRDILYQYSENVGEIHEENGVLIASIQSLYYMTQNEDRGSLPELSKYLSIVIIDEAHHAVSSNKSYSDVLHALGFEFRNVLKKDADINENQVRLLGLTATPFRGNETLGKNSIDLLNRFGKRHRILWPPFTENVDTDNIPPFAHIDVQKTSFQGERIKIYGDKSYDKDGQITQYRFVIYKLFSGTTYSPNSIIFDKSTAEKNIDFVFEEPGRYQIQLFVTDNSGEISKNLAGSNLEVFPNTQREEKATPEEMKRLYKNLIQRGILSMPHHYIIDNSKIPVNLNDEKDIERFKQFHDVTHATIRKIGNDPHRNNKIIKKIISLVRNEDRKSILFFACSIAHSKLISFILNAIYGIKSASIDHTLSIEERDKIIQDFRNKKILVLCNYDILTTGFDSPKVECIFVARPTFSHLLYNQMIGRGLRGPKSNGTENCIIVDISDNIQLVLEDEIVEQPWRIFDYIYKSTFDERETSKEQKCYGCFGLKHRIYEGKLDDCKICQGKGVISTKYTPNISDNTNNDFKEKLGAKQKEIFSQNPNLSLKDINERAKKALKYDALLDSKRLSEKPSEEWGAICKNCNKISHDVTMTLAHFGRSQDLVTNDNPKGIFDECKECRNKNNYPTNSKLEYAHCPKCGKSANGIDDVEKLFGFRIVNNKKVVQSWCFECR